ncbi:unnamed protein product [Tilletia controversa]|uniref:DUF221-domain-containing protein n=1 Tax=Tilletia controversa TaxID=13291 RepID=A0A8X7MQI3_9BASI|nr:hypothetical protein CF328_g4867 [Tilletia controversa]KAE8245314.1 hypothetical protein A4X06_0g5740 [Tilletia controversa]CAD6896656.1 unnamed protein product [Tilletia controversa]
MSGCDQDSQDPLCLTTLALTQASQVQAPAVAISAGSWIGFSLATIFLFQLLRPNNKIVYAPKLKYAEKNEKAPPRIEDGFFSWLPPLFKYHEADLLPIIGLDAVTFLRFLRMCRWLTLALAILMSVVLMPVNLAYNARNPSRSRSGISFLDRISMTRVSGTYIWAHVAMSYLGSLLAIGFIYFNYKRMLVLRHAWFRSPQYQSQFHSRTLMITGVKKQMQSDEALSGVLSSIGMPYPTTEVHIGRVVGALPDLIDKHNDFVRALERVFATYLKDPRNLPSKRPTTTIGGSMGCGGKRVDAIDYYTDQINKCETAIENWRERIGERKPESYGFASLAAVAYAHAAARSLKNKKPRGLVIDLAPAPKDIIWKNLNLTQGQRFRSSVIGFLFLCVLLFFNAVPLLAVSLITNMASFRFLNGLGWLDGWYQKSQFSFAAVAALVPPAITGVMGYFLPILMRRLAQYRGVLTKSRRDRVIVGQYFSFLVISQFLVFSLIGIIITMVAYIVSAATTRHQNYKDILEHIQKSLPGQIKRQYFLTSNYWLTWLPLRGFLAVLDLAQVVKLVLVWFQKGLFGRTPRDVREYTKPPSFDYAIYYANLLFMFAVAMLYAPLVPLVVVFSSAAFWVSSGVYKYQLMYVFTTKNESGGRLWRVVVNRMLVCIVFMQLILTLAIALDQGYIKSVATLPPILFVLAFKLYLRKTMDRHFTWYIPTPAELSKETIHSGDSRHNRLQRRFGHPALHDKLFTPMVHAKVKHLLPRVYSGRIDEMSKVDGDTTASTRVTGGLKIAAIEENQLEWNRERDDDARSIMSSTTLGNIGPGNGRFTPRGPGSPGTQVGVGAGGPNDYFKSQYAAYLAGGAGVERGHTPSMGGTMTDDFEMGHYPNKGSRDNLLDHVDSVLVGHGGPQYVAYQQQGGHGKKSSGDLYAEYYASPTQTPGQESLNAFGGMPMQHAQSTSGDAGMGMYASQGQMQMQGPGQGQPRSMHAAQRSNGSLPFVSRTPVPGQGYPSRTGTAGSVVSSAGGWGGAPAYQLQAQQGPPQLQLQMHHQRQGTGSSMGMMLPPPSNNNEASSPVSPAGQVQAQYEQRQSMMLQQQQQQRGGQQQQWPQQQQQQGYGPGLGQGQGQSPYGQGPGPAQGGAYPGPPRGPPGGYRGPGGPPGPGNGNGTGYHPMR